MTVSTPHRSASGRRRLISRRRRLAVVAGAALLGAFAFGALFLWSNDASREPPEVAPVRVTSGAEIATGFAVGRDRVVTVAHVLEGAVTVGRARAHVVRVDRRSDLALLAVPGVVAGVPDFEAADAGDEVRIVRLRDGHAAMLSVHVRRPIVAHVRELGAERRVTRPALELAGRVAAGDSGAPVVSRSGALVSVVFATSSHRAGTVYAVDAGVLRRILARD